MCCITFKLLITVTLLGLFLIRGPVRLLGEGLEDLLEESEALLEAAATPAAEDEDDREERTDGEDPVEASDGVALSVEVDLMI